VIAGALGIAAFGFIVYAGFAGTQAATANIEPTVIYVMFWVAIPFLSAVFGDVFAAFNPWRAIARGVAFVAGRVTRGRLPEPMAYPAWLGRWPAAIGILCFAWVELVYVNRDDPSTLAILALLYAATQLVGMSLYGIEPWTRNADAFGVLFGLFAALAPITRRDGVLYLRPPVLGATQLEARRGTTAVLLAAIGATAFDGAQGGPLFNNTVPHLQDAFEALGFSTGTALELGFVVGLFVVCGVVSLIWFLGVAGMPRVNGKRPGRAFVHTLVPILAAYVVAHYFSLLAYNGQDLARLASDPLGDGSDLFGTAGSTIDYGVVSATAIWYVQVGALIAGHVSGLVLAHDRALSVYGGHREASRSQVVMLVVMVVFTVLGLWLLSEANG